MEIRIGIIVMDISPVQIQTTMLLPEMGNGICFWADCTNYKISMGNAADYLYGTVSDYSIKTQMSQ
jgi:cellulose synthase/poly-beta-1,6-N-acetylglucosamine synthase-like glycosyltransferase